MHRERCLSMKLFKALSPKQPPQQNLNLNYLYFKDPDESQYFFGVHPCIIFYIFLNHFNQDIAYVTQNKSSYILLMPISLRLPASRILSPKSIHGLYPQATPTLRHWYCRETFASWYLKQIMRVSSLEVTWLRQNFQGVSYYVM